MPWLGCDCMSPAKDADSTHMMGFPCRLGCRVGMGSSRLCSLPALGHPHSRRGSSQRPRSHTLVC